MEELVEIVRRGLVRNIEDGGDYGRFATFFFGELDKDGTLNYVNAGHDPPLHLHGNEFRELDEGGLLLASFPKDVKVGYRKGRARLEEGDVLVLYTDGITETQSSDREMYYGIERLKEAIYLGRDGTAERIARGIIKSVDEYRSGARRTDDKTLLVVKRLLMDCSGAENLLQWQRGRLL